MLSVLNAKEVSDIINHKVCYMKCNKWKGKTANRVGPLRGHRTNLINDVISPYVVAQNL